MNIRQKAVVVGGMVALQFVPLFAFATITNACDIIGLLRSAGNWFGIIVGLLGTISILYAAFLFLIAGGGEEAVTKAKSTLLWGVIGIAVAILAFSAVPIVEQTLGNRLTLDACRTGPTRL